MSIAERITAFEEVRDLPYHIPLTDKDTNLNCVGKAVLLAEKLHALGLETRQIICTFDWTETPLPQDILDLPRDPGETHLFLQVFIPETNQWVNCDPSWDQAVGKAGFPIATWDGLNDTALAVEPLMIYDAEESLEILEDESDPDLHKQHMKLHRTFYRAINEWLAEQR